MLGNQTLIAFVATANSEHSRTFYERTLGLQLVSDDAFALTQRRAHRLVQGPGWKRAFAHGILKEGRSERSTAAPLAELYGSVARAYRSRSV